MGQLRFEQPPCRESDPPPLQRHLQDVDLGRGHRQDGHEALRQGRHERMLPDVSSNCLRPVAKSVFTMLLTYPTPRIDFRFKTKRKVKSILASLCPKQTRFNKSIPSSKVVTSLFLHAPNSFSQYFFIMKQNGRLDRLLNKMNYFAL